MVMKQKSGFQGEQSIVLPPMIIEAQRQDPLVSGLYITDIGYYPKAQNHYRERLVPIDEHVLIYCVQGRGWYRVGEKEYQVKENQYFILPARQRHAYGADDEKPWTIYWVHFRAYRPTSSQGEP